MNKDHWAIARYKKDYNQIKAALEHFSSGISEFLHFEASGISEKGLRKLLATVGNMRQAVFANARQNKELFMRTHDVLENYYKPALRNVSKKLKTQ